MRKKMYSNWVFDYYDDDDDDEGVGCTIGYLDMVVCVTVLKRVRACLCLCIDGGMKWSAPWGRWTGQDWSQSGPYLKHMEAWKELTGETWHLRQYLHMQAECELWILFFFLLTIDSFYQGLFCFQCKCEPIYFPMHRHKNNLFFFSA